MLDVCRPERSWYFLQLWNIMLIMPSTVIQNIRYNPISYTLRITFISGTVYDYLDVPPEIYVAMKASGSKGTYLNTHIKGHFNFRKIT